jgi:hypothetical protein
MCRHRDSVCCAFEEEIRLDASKHEYAAVESSRVQISRGTMLDVIECKFIIGARRMML